MAGSPSSGNASLGVSAKVTLGIGICVVGIAIVTPPLSRYLKRREQASDAEYNNAVGADREAAEARAKRDAARKGLNVIPGLGDILLGKG